MPVAITNDTGFISAVSELTLAPDDPIKSEVLYNQKIFPNFLHNDLLIANKFANIPKIWECLWYNDPTRNGYPVGTLCWRNIEDIYDFIYTHYSDIYSYAEENKHILTKPPRIVNVSQLNDGDTYDAYVNVLTGWVNEQRTSDPLSMLYDLGDVAEPPQVYVSLIDNNKCTLDDRTAWKPILVTQRSVFKELSSHGYALAKWAIDKHLSVYHLKNTAEGTVKGLGKYLNSDLTNFKFPFNYYINPTDQVIEGMDWPIKFVERPLVFSENGSDLSGTIVEHQWFRLWKSGYLEHGGTIDLHRHKNKSGFPEVHFNWQLSNLNGTNPDGARLANRGFLGGRGESSSAADDTALCVYEGIFAQNNEEVPGDNLLSVMYATNGTLRLNTDFKTKKFVNMNEAPVFALSIYPYHLEMCPIRPDFPFQLSNATSAYVEDENPFPTPTRSVGFQSYLYDAALLSNCFQISAYESDNGLWPRFISYYASGWSVKYISDAEKKDIKGEPTEDEW